MRPFARMSGPVAPLALLLAAVVGWLSTTHGAATRTRRAGRQIISDIDGARHRPRSARRRPAASGAHVGGAAVGRRPPAAATICADSLIVRFRPGTCRARCSGPCWRRWTATAGPTLSYADFEIVTLAAAATPKPWRSGCARSPTSSTRSRGTGCGRCSCRTIRSTRCSGTIPQIDMERAWDINRGGSSNVIVAILDTGVAFRSAMLRYTAIAWQRAGRRRCFPRSGRWTFRLRPAPDLGADRFVAPARLHLGRPAALRPGRSRHARGGHRRPAHQQRRRRRRAWRSTSA